MAKFLVQPKCLVHFLESWFKRPHGQGEGGMTAEAHGPRGRAPTRRSPTLTTSLENQKCDA